jgi:hypothetical protein
MPPINANMIVPINGWIVFNADEARNRIVTITANFLFDI